MSTLLADAGVEKANATVTVINTRLTETQVDVIALRDRLAGLALIAAVDPDHAGELIELRARLAQSEASMRELSAAEVLARDMAREAQRKALQAAAKADWEAAGMALDEAAVTAGALDSVLKSAGDLFSQVQQLMTEAAARVGRHLARPEYAVPLPDIDNVAKLVLSNAGGPPVVPSTTLHLDAAQQAQANIAAIVARHSRQVMAHRPTSTTEQEEADHAD